jgi:type II secretory pathway component PulC
MLERVASSVHSLVRGLVRRTWIVTLLAVLACSAFAAQAASAIVEAEALSPSSLSPPPRVPPPVVAAAPTRVPLDGADLVARNMFCSTCAPPDPGPTGNPSAVFTGKPAILIATAIGKDPRATVRVPETEVQGDWSLGDRIPGVGTIDRIGSVSIDVVDTGGVRATLRLFDLPADPRKQDAATSREDPPDPFADSITKIDEKTYEVRRELVRELVTGVQKPGKVRMMPIVNKDGEVGGVRVYGVTAGSLPAALGLKSADTIDSINGEPIKSAQQLLDLYAKLDQLNVVELGGKRGGKPLAIELRLR